MRTKEENQTFLTKEIVYQKIKDEEGVVLPLYQFRGDIYCNALYGYDVKIVEEGRTFKASVYAPKPNKEGGLVAYYNEPIFSFEFNTVCLDYYFEHSAEAEEFLDSMPDYFTSWDKMSKEDLAKYLIVMDEKRDLMYEWEIYSTHELECDMREVAYVLAELVLEEQKDEVDTEDGSQVELEVLVGLIKDELKGCTPSKEELHALVKKYCDGCKDLDDIIKEVECKISFSMEVGVVV